MKTALTPAELAQEARGHYQRGDAAAAAQSFLAAAGGFSALGESLTAAEMRNNASVSLLKNGQPAAALSAVAGTDQVFLAAGDTRRQGLALGNIAAAFEALDRLEEAAASYSQSADLLRSAGADEERLYVLQSLSQLQLRRAQPLQAVVTLNAGLESKKNLTLRQRLVKRLLAIPLNWMTGKN